MQKLDYIIVGGGIAGIFCAYHLQKQGQKVHLISDSKTPSASQVAAGTWNPIAFKRFILSWRAQEFLHEMNIQYPELESLLNEQFYEFITAKKLITPGNELQLWEQQANTSEMKSYMVTNPPASVFPKDFFLGELKQTGRVQLPVLLPAFHQYLAKSGAFEDEKFDYNLLQQKDSGWVYKNTEAKRVIFCEGAHIQNNPFFSWLPLKSAKGDVIIIHSPGLKLDYILKKNIFILPIGDDQYEVGATYDWKNLDWEPNEEGVAQLCEKLKMLIQVPFTVIGKKAGIRPTSYDRRIIMGKHPEEKGLFAFNGLGTKGVLLAPLAAKEFADYLVNNIQLNPEMDINRCLKYYQKR